MAPSRQIHAKATDSPGGGWGGGSECGVWCCDAGRSTPLRGNGCSSGMWNISLFKDWFSSKLILTNNINLCFPLNGMHKGKRRGEEISVYSPFCGILVTEKKFYPLSNEWKGIYIAHNWSHEICPPWPCPAHGKSSENLDSSPVPATGSLHHLLYLGSSSDFLGLIIFHMRDVRAICQGTPETAWGSGCMKARPTTPMLKKKKKGSPGASLFNRVIYSTMEEEGKEGRERGGFKVDN